MMNDDEWRWILWWMMVDDDDDDDGDDDISVFPIILGILLF